MAVLQLAVLCLIISASKAQTAADDKLALLAFRAGGDPDGHLSSWSATDGTNEPCSGWSCCSGSWRTDGWAGVRCTAPDYSSGRVREVSLSHKTFTGNIGTLAALDALEKLDLGNCGGVTGDVHDLPLNGLTTQLFWLNLVDTAVGGTVDHLAACTQLVVLALEDTAITGSVEPLAACTELNTLNLARTAVTGSVASLSPLTRLQQLNLESTAVTGSVQTLGASLGLLTTLDLSDTSVSGALALGGCGSLRTLDCTNCASVSGSIEWLGGCGLLTTVLLGGTSVSGSISPMGALPALWTLDLTEVGAGITGSVEPLGACASLTLLKLTGCTNVAGSVAQLSSCTALTDLELARTAVGGFVEPLAALTALTMLTLADTAVAGSTDPLGAALTSLSTLDLQRTALYGDAAPLRALPGLGGSWAGYSPCSIHTCTDDDYGPGYLISNAYLRVGRDDCECCTPPVSFLREADSGICVPIRDCDGEWSDCTADCEPAASRSWVETVAQSGTGVECPSAADCLPAEDLCPPAVNCSGSHSRCTAGCEAAGQRLWMETVAQSGGGAGCPTAVDCAAGDDDCVEDSYGQLVLIGAGVGVPGLTLLLSAWACVVFRRRRQDGQLDVVQAGRTLKTSNFRKAYAKSQPPNTRDMLWTGLADLLQAYCSRSEIPWDFEGEQFLRHLQEEAEKNKQDSIPQAVQRMWTSPLRLRNKELCSILNFAVRSDSNDMVRPLAMLTRAINLLCVTAGKADKLKNISETNLIFRGGGFDERHREFFTQNKKFRQPAYLATSFSKDVAKIFMGRAAKGQSKMLWLVRIHPVRKCVHVNLVTKRVAGLGSEQEYLFAPYSVFTVREVQWRAGTTEEPHVIELLAAPDNKDEPEDLPLAPWS